MLKTQLLKVIFLALIAIILLACKEEKARVSLGANVKTQTELKYAKGFSIQKNSDFTILNVHNPWPNATKGFTYALIPKEKLSKLTLNKEEFDAIIGVPLKKLVVTSTTHIPALEALGVEENLVGFPDTKYISSKKTRALIETGKIVELGNHETLNTEKVIELNPELVVGFGISGQTSAYETLQRSNIAVVYNGDWTEEMPLGKAEWIKFFALFFQKEADAETIFTGIENDYLDAKELAKKVTEKPTVLSGALYKDVWYLPGGKSWAAHFLKDANANYLWNDSDETGSLSLSWETVLQKAKNAAYWIGPAQFTGYTQMQEASAHYEQFDAFSEKKVYTFANTKGTTGGLLYYELAPQRPDLVLKDLIHILHPTLLPDYETLFFTPLEK